ncbi:MAG TPA: hypothetical protein VF399_13010 [bacterium]
MRYPILIVLTVSMTAFGAWEAVGPYGGDARSAVVSYINDNIVYVTSNNSPTNVAKSTNGGINWTTVGSIANQAYCLAIDPTNNNKLYAGSGHVIYRTTDGGVNWASTSMSNKYIYGIIDIPGTPATVYASGMSWDGAKWVMAFFKSTDSGVSWSTTTLNTVQGQCNCIAVDRLNPLTAYVGGYWSDSLGTYPAVFKTTNGGTNWTDITGTIPSGAYYIYSLAVHPTNSSIVYAGTYLSGIYRSTDGGSSWTQTSTNYYNYSMATSIATPDEAFAGGYNEIYKTTNAGASWFSVNTGLAGYGFYGLAVSQSSSSRVYAADNNGVFKTTSGGTSWSNTNNNLNLGSICSFAAAPSSPSTMYTSFEAIGVFKTTNNGTDWAQVPTPVGCGNICEFAVNNTNPNIVYALEGSG